MQSEPVDAQSQQAMDRWRQRREAGPGKTAPAAGTTAAGVLLMLVVDVIVDDPQYGTHLVTVPVAMEGIPPTVRYLMGPRVRCYPMPGRSVDDFSATDIVKVYCGSGASLAEKLT